jgi:hypothetical protein
MPVSNRLAPNVEGESYKTVCHFNFQGLLPNTYVYPCKLS